MDLIEFFLLCVENHQLTLREVCRVVGFRSYNQLARLLQHKTSPMKVLEFGQLLLDHASQLRLTAEECQSIRDCMFPLLKGKENVYAFEHFFSLITTLQVEAAFPNADLLLMDMQGHPAGSLRKLLSNADSAEISVINCIHSNVLRIIASCVHDVNLSVNYYYCEAQSISSSVDAVCDIWPYLFCEWLHPYSVRAATHQGLWTGDVIFVHLAHQKAPNSTSFEDFEIVLYSKETAIAIPLPIHQNCFCVTMILIFMNYSYSHTGRWRNTKNTCCMRIIWSISTAFFASNRISGWSLSILTYRLLRLEMMCLAAATSRW